MGKISKKAIQKARNNPDQLMLRPNSEQGAGTRDIGITKEMTTLTPKYYCPFCLYFGYKRDFTHYLKSKKESKRLLCPECKNQMTEPSLTGHKTIEEYAEWVAAYASSGFWQKIPFKTFNDRLFRLGWSRIFWKRYKEVRATLIRPIGSSDNEPEQEQEEWLKYQQQEEQEKAQWTKEQENKVQ